MVLACTLPRVDVAGPSPADSRLQTTHVSAKLTDSRPEWHRARYAEAATMRRDKGAQNSK